MQQTQAECASEDIAQSLQEAEALLEAHSEVKVTKPNIFFTKVISKSLVLLTCIKSHERESDAFDDFFLLFSLDFLHQQFMFFGRILKHKGDREICLQCDGSGIQALTETFAFALQAMLF